MTTPAPADDRVARFRTRLQLVMMLTVAGATALVLGITQRNAASSAQESLEREFQSEFAALQHVQEARHATLLGLCKALVQKSRIHAALEDDALDLLYPSARDELRELRGPGEDGGAAVRADFYRFLDRKGGVIRPGSHDTAGRLAPAEESALSLSALPKAQQLGYVLRASPGGVDPLREIVATPIVSTETGETISALVLGFAPLDAGPSSRAPGVFGGVWAAGHLQISGVDEETRSALEKEISASVARSGPDEVALESQLAGVRRLVFHRQINPGSLYPPAYQVGVYPLTELEAAQRLLLWQVVGVAALVLALGLAFSHLIAGRLAAPVEKLAHDSDLDRAERERAEAALEVSHRELQRAARFSSDASHQLKTPVTVLRLGLEELLARPGVGEKHSEEISALVHQTYRLAGVVDDLLLLSMMDAGRLQLERTPLELHRLIEGWLDDLGALPDPFELTVATEIPRGLYVSGAKRYTGIVLQNLLENARKYNRRGGRIRVEAHTDGADVVVTIGNTGAPIPAAAQEHIFDRFHRGAMGENVPGHGLGLNLARELARVHGGELRLIRSADDWTEFELRLQKADPPQSANAAGAAP
ncbi:hypothetical protein DB347_22440 [Opitutaceae bacterium EW11]|nr:hypothetical protein DB347_22440 [Opitutaceae bacterium EW11]